MGLGVIFLEGIRYFYKLIFKDNTKDESNITSENKKISEKRIENVKSENLREVQTEKLSNKPGRVSGNNTFKVSNLSESDSEIYKNSMVIGILVTLVGIVISIPFIIGSIFSNNNLSNTKPQDSSTKPKDSPTKPQDSPTKPHDSPTKPQDNPKKPHDSPTKPHDSSTNLTILQQNSRFFYKTQDNLNLTNPTKLILLQNSRFSLQNRVLNHT